MFHAERAFTANTNLAEDPAIEILLYASGERQIKLAIEKIGIKKGSRSFGMVVYSKKDTEGINNKKQTSEIILKDLGLNRDDTRLEGGRDVLERFGISDTEIDKVPQSRWLNLVLSRVAMVDIIK